MTNTGADNINNVTILDIILEKALTYLYTGNVFSVIWLDFNEKLTIKIL